MKRVFYHIMRLFRKFWYLLMIAFAISPIMGLGVLIIATVISMTLFGDPVEAKDPSDYFTEDELRMLQSGEVDDEEEYLTLLAKYQTYECPVKIDKITTWTSSAVTKESYIFNYEIYDRWHRYGEIDKDTVKSNLLSQIDKDGCHVKYIVATNRNLIFRYWNRETDTVEDIVISTDELRS